MREKGEVDRRDGKERREEGRCLPLNSGCDTSIVFQQSNTSNQYIL